jgi:hypothetical protein
LLTESDGFNLIAFFCYYDMAFSGMAGSAFGLVKAFYTYALK